MMKIVLLGPPGSGKGTQAQMICEKFNIPHISTGDIFRKNIKENTPLGKKANEYISQGSLVPDSLTIDIVKDRLKESDCKNGFVLDGFPRNLLQTQELDKMTSIDKAIMINIKDEEIIKRLSGRRMCKECGNPTHIDWLKDGKCEKCGGEVFVREDDKPEIVKARLQKQKLPTKVVEFYKNKNVFYEVYAKTTKEEVFNDILKILEGK